MEKTHKITILAGLATLAIAFGVANFYINSPIESQISNTQQTGEGLEPESYDETYSNQENTSPPNTVHQFYGSVRNRVSEIQTTVVREGQYEVMVGENIEGDMSSDVIVISDLNCNFRSANMYVFVGVTYNQARGWYNCEKALPYFEDY